MNKKTLSERDICTKFITPALEKAGWDKHGRVWCFEWAQESWAKKYGRFPPFPYIIYFTN